MNDAARGWSIAVDTGGTFTDCIARDPGGRLKRAKVLSSGALRARVIAAPSSGEVRVRLPSPLPEDFLAGASLAPVTKPGVGGVRIIRSSAGADVRLDLAPAVRSARGLEQSQAVDLVSALPAPVLAAHVVTETPLRAELPPGIRFRLATTRGTNALLERRGAPLVLLVTEGFGDLLEIGTQAREDLFALDVRKREGLVTRTIEVPERVAADGSILRALDLDALADPARETLRSGIHVAAVALAHAYRNPAHEHALATFLRDLGFRHVSLSSTLAPGIRLLPRAETAVVNAALAPVVGAFIEEVRGAIGSASVHVMTSAGGLVRDDAYTPKDSLLSGPAGGVVGARAAARAAGIERALAFDMGGTSTDVSRIDGDLVYRWEQRVGGVHLLSPGLWIESVAAGGGSICSAARGELSVGPESAGADPGPAAYGAGGPLTLTDVNLLLGRLVPDTFQVPLDAGAARAALEAVCATRADLAADGDSLLAGFVAIAEERMADAIRRVSLREGVDPADYALVAFGGAGGQHAAGIAERLGIRRVIVPPDAGILSAVGLAAAVIERIAERTVLEPLDRCAERLPPIFEALEREVADALSREGVPLSGIVIGLRSLALRFSGQDDTMEILYERGLDEPAEAGRALAGRFVRLHAERFGHVPEERGVEVVTARVVARSRSHWPETEPEPVNPSVTGVTGGMRSESGRSGRRHRVHAGGDWQDAPLLRREELEGTIAEGPALVLDAHGTTLVAAGWRASLDASGAIALEQLADRAEGGGAGAHKMLVRAGQSEAVKLELFVSRFRAVADEMGEVLRRTALSVNVKERLDYSCAVVDPDGRLVVNAPHVPVHLGALGVCVRALVERLPLGSGEVAITNLPGVGGSHLPDVTLVAPVHAPDGTLVGYVANRAHHAEIGGTRPGSMPADARTLEEEGVAIAPMRLIEGGEARWGRLRRVLSEAAHPSRAVEENIADVRAQLAACHRGRDALSRLAAAHGSSEVIRYMHALERRAADRVRAALAARGDGTRRAIACLDDGTEIRVAVCIEGERASIDFSGSSPPHPGNLNATEAVVRSAVAYVVRLLVDEPLPLNEGLLDPVEIRLPRSFLNPELPDDPRRSSAVAAGNVETSQRVVDALIEAFALAAGSQGTMNNVLFGNGRVSYYETLGGGAGAGPSFEGASAIHTHMTNTRITDVEVIENRLPVRVDRFAIRRGSGGAGTRRGGDGLVRALTFTERVSLSVVTQHRAFGPRGMAGGEDGECGRQWIERVGGGHERLGAIDGAELDPGDRFVIETPGGGGWGPPSGGVRVPGPSDDALAIVIDPPPCPAPPTRRGRREVR